MGNIALQEGCCEALGACPSGCEDAAKKPAQTRVPALAPPKPATTPQTPMNVGVLPMPDLLQHPMTPLQPPIPGGIDYLIARVKEKFAAGEANYKAGHLAAARRDFDDAIDWMLESGYDPNSDPRLSELFHNVTDTVYTYELQSVRAGDGFTEAPAVPAPIDEVAEMTSPADPKLREHAEEPTKSSSHDFPLTANS